MTGQFTEEMLLTKSPKDFSTPPNNKINAN